VADLMEASAPDASLLARFVNTLRQTQESAPRGAVHAWEHRMVRRQHASMWRHEVLAALWVAGHHQQLRQGEALAFPDRLELRRVSAANRSGMGVCLSHRDHNGLLVRR
jgi:hypothetical protein